MPDITFVAMLDEVRKMTFRVLEGVDEVTARWRPTGLSNSIVWHAGHDYVVLETIAMESLNQATSIPFGWDELFSWNSRPAEIPAENYPPLSEVVAALQAQYGRLRTVFEQLSEADLAMPAHAWPEKSVREMILHAFHDEAAHKGEIWLLRKLQRLQTAAS